MRRLAAMLAALAVACSAPTGATSTVRASPVSCEEPPASEIETDPPIVLAVDPNPAMARAVAELSVSSDGLSDDTVVSVDARWQCWDGSAWVTTHNVYRGFGDNAGQTIAVSAGIDIQVPDIGLSLQDGYPIVIPQVAPGRYRVEDDVFVDGEPVNGFVIVEVVED